MNRHLYNDPTTKSDRVPSERIRPMPSENYGIYCEVDTWLILGSFDNIA